MIVEFFITEDKKFAYRYKARNGTVLVTSHGYSTYRKCVEGWHRFKRMMWTSGRPHIRCSKELIDL